MKHLCSLVTSLVVGVFAFASVGAAKLRFVQPNGMVREVQEMQMEQVLAVPRKLGLFTTKVRSF